MSASVSLSRFLFGELVIACGSSARVLASMNVPSGAPSPYRGLVPGSSSLDPATVARVVRVRRAIAATYAMLGVVIPLFVAVRLAVVGWSGMKLDDPVSVVVTIAVTLLLMTVVGGALALGGLWLARPIVGAILDREARRAV